MDYMSSSFIEKSMSKHHLKLTYVLQTYSNLFFCDNSYFRTWISLCQEMLPTDISNSFSYIFSSIDIIFEF